MLAMAMVFRLSGYPVVSVYFYYLFQKQGKVKCLSACMLRFNPMKVCLH